MNQQLLLDKEAQHFSNKNKLKHKKSSFSRIRYFQQQIKASLDLEKEVLKLVSRPKCLALGCGDMKGEYRFFQSMKASEIDAFDISDGQKNNFYDKVYDSKIPVDYKLSDVNKIELKPEYYDLVYIQHAYHHFTNLEHITSQIYQSLKPNGIFALNDYVGPKYLQRSKSQLEVCEQIWNIMSNKYKRKANGQLCNKVHVPDKEKLSPFEAIRSDEIIPTLEKHFQFKEKFVYGGVVFPLVNGFSHNYNQKDVNDMLVLKMLWTMDRILIDNKIIQPNFCLALMSK